MNFNWQTFKQTILNQWVSHWLIAVLLVLFVGFSWLALPDQKLGEYPVFNSPDETANYFFARRFALTDNFKFDDIYAVASNGHFLPRSMQLSFNMVAPTGFIGLPLIFGFISKYIGVSWLYLLTPLIMVLALALLYIALTVNYGYKISWLTTVLIGLQPGWLYSANRPLMSTGLFVAMVILALAFFWLTLKYNRVIFYALTGVFVGLALLVRLSEMIWLLPLAILLMVMFRKKLYWLGLVVSFICVLPSLALVGTYNYKNFASPVQFGYKNITAEPTTAFVHNIIFPFGVNLTKAWEHWQQYTFQIFPIATILGLIGFAYLLFYLLKRKRTEYLVYLLVGLLICGYLIVYYGSWTFFDNPDPKAVTIGNSFVRYFLPITILIAPLLAFGLMKIKNLKLKLLVSLVTIVLLLYSSVQIVWQGKDEGVLTLQKTLTTYKQVRQKALEVTPGNAIIISNKMDKAVFPFRRVVLEPVDWAMVAKYGFDNNNFYFLSKTLTDDRIVLMNKMLTEHKISFGKGEALADNFSIYQVIKIHENN